MATDPLFQLWQTSYYPRIKRGLDAVLEIQNTQHSCPEDVYRFIEKKRKIVARGLAAARFFEEITYHFLVYQNHDFWRQRYESLTGVAEQLQRQKSIWRDSVPKNPVYNDIFEAYVVLSAYA
jgi:hypothetical protein